MFAPEAFLAAWLSDHDDARAQRVATFLAPANTARRYAMGRNAHSLALGERIELAGYVDDFTGEGAMWGGKPVVPTHSLCADDIVVNCVFSQRPVSAERRLIGAKCQSIAYSDLLRAAPEQIPPPDFVMQMRADLEAHAERWQALSERMADAESRQTLWDIVRYRLTGDIGFMSAYSWRVTEQYFDPVAAPGPDCVFVDAGGYDGDTTEAVCDRFPNYARAYIFEPSPANMTKARARLAGRRDIVFHACGLGERAHIARFDPASGSASAVSDAGALEIEIQTIDAVIAEPVGFIKLDIEGEELNALRGASRQIAAHAPIIAAAVYHSAADFWRIADLVTGLRDDYRIYLRHYTEGWAETVMYLVKR